MDTDGFDFNRNVAPIDGADDAFAPHPHDSFRRFNWIMKQRVRSSARDKRTVRHVVSIRENLSRRLEFQFDRGNLQGAAGWNEEDEPRIDGEHGVSNGMGQCLIARRHIIKSAVRFNVVHLAARSCTKRFKSTNLISHEGENVRGAYFPFDATKTLAIGKTGMGADSNAPRFGCAD